MLFAKRNTFCMASRRNTKTALCRPNSIAYLLRGAYSCPNRLITQSLIFGRSEHTSSSADEANYPKRKTSDTHAHYPSLLRRASTLISVAVIFTTAGYLVGTSPILSLAFSRVPTDKESLALFDPEDETTAEIELRLQSHPYTKSLRADPLLEESRPHLKFPPATRAVNLTAGILLGPGKLVLPPLVFSSRDGSHLASLQYLGPKLCGHPGIIHGGLLATMLDEGLARCCFPALPNKIGVTASLKIEYRKPCPADGFVVLKAMTVKVEGRKAWVKGRIESLVEPGASEPPIVYAEAEALFVEPKFAASMAKLYSAK